MSSPKFIITTHAVIILLLTTAGTCMGFSNTEIYQFQKQASETNKTLPKMTSSEMELTRVEFRGDSEIVYVTKTTLYNADQINTKQLENNLKPTAVNIGCNSPTTLNLLKRGLKYTYVYYDKTNKYLSEYSITAKDCGF